MTIKQASKEYQAFTRTFYSIKKNPGLRVRVRSRSKPRTKNIFPAEPTPMMVKLQAESFEFDDKRCKT
jgi:hypothetical protein